MTQREAEALKPGDAVVVDGRDRGRVAAVVYPRVPFVLIWFEGPGGRFGLSTGIERVEHAPCEACADA